MATTKRISKRKNGHIFAGARLHNGLAYRPTLKSAKKTLSDAKERFTEVEENVQKYAKAHPWKTMGMTLIAGVVVGKMLGK